MRPTELENLLKTMRTAAPSRLDRRVYATIDRAAEQPRPRMGVWRIIMQSPITKLAVAAAFIVGMLFLAQILIGEEPASIPSKENYVTQPPDTNPVDEPQVQPEVQEHLTLARSLYEQHDQDGLLDLLLTCSETTQIVIAGYLAEIGDEEAIPTLQKLADTWQGQGANPYQQAIEQIFSRQQQETSSQEANVEPQALSQSEEVQVASVEQVICQGRVSDQNGLPIADVRVWAQVFNRKMECRVLAEEAVTDEQGEFLLKASISGNPDSQMFIIYFDHPEYGLWAYLIPPQKTSSYEDMHVTLYPAETILGTITDPKGRAISGATVEAAVQIVHHEQKDDIMLRWTMMNLSVQTDEQGIFVLDRLPEPARVRLRINADGYGTYISGADSNDEDERYPFQAGDEDVQIVMDPGGVIRGKVLQPNGQPYDKPVVIVDETDEKFAHADSQGQFVIESVSPGLHRLEASARTGVDLCAAQYVEVSASSTEQGIIFVVQEKKTIEVFVTDEQTGKPVSDVWLYVRLPLSEKLEENRIEAGEHSDHQGLAELHLFPGEYTLRVESWEEGTRSYREMGLTVTSDPKIQKVQVEISSQPTFSGQLIDLQGHPVEGYIGNWSDELIPTDVNGVFEMRLLPGDANNLHLLRVFDKSKQRGNAILCSSSDLYDGIQFTVEHFATLMGRMVDSEAHPDAQASIYLSVESGNRGWQWREDPEIAPDGTFVFNNVPYGHPLHLSGNGNSSGFAQINPLNPNELYDVGDVIIHTYKNRDGSLERRSVIRGTVINEAGEPVVGATVETQVTDARRNPITTITDYKGRFTLRGLPDAEPIGVYVSMEGYGDSGGMVMPDGNECTIQIFPRGWHVLGKQAPELKIAQWYNSKPITMAQLQGKVVLLQMCFVVPQESVLLPLSELYKTYHSQGLEIIAIRHSLIKEVEDLMSEESFDEWIQEKGIQFPIALDQAADGDTNDQGPRLGVTMGRCHVNRIPATFLIDKQGDVRVLPERDELEEWIQILLDE